MLKVIPVEEAVGLPLAHDITSSCPASTKAGVSPGPYRAPGRHFEVTRCWQAQSLCDGTGKGRAARRGRRAPARHSRGRANLSLTDPSEGRINLVATISGLLKVDADRLYRFNSLGDLMMATLPGDRYVKEGTVVAGTRTIPVIVKEELIRKAEAICKEKPIVTILPMPAKRIHLVVTGSEVFTGRIKDGFGPVVSKKVGELGSELESIKLAPDDPDVIAGHIKDAQRAGADVILVSGGMSVDPDDKTPEGIRRSGAKVETHGFPVLPGSMFVMAYLDKTPVMGLSGCVLHDPFTAFDALLPRLLAGEKISRADIMAMGHGGLQRKHDH